MQMERDEFHLVRAIDKPPWKQSTNGDAQPSERHSSDQHQTYQDSAKQDYIHDQVADIVLLVEERVLVPGDIGIVADRAEQSARFIL